MLFSWFVLFLLGVIFQLKMSFLSFQCLDTSLLINCKLFFCFDQFLTSDIFLILGYPFLLEEKLFHTFMHCISTVFFHTPFKPTWQQWQILLLTISLIHQQYHSIILFRPYNSPNSLIHSLKGLFLIPLFRLLLWESFLNVVDFLLDRWLLAWQEWYANDDQTSA